MFAALKIACPFCTSFYFSVTPLTNMPRDTREKLFPPGTIGVADCQCDRQFAVQLPPELFNAFSALFAEDPLVQKKVLETFFPGIVK